MRRILIVSAGLLSLTACDSQPTVTARNASVADVAARARATSKIEPGKWRTTVSLLSFDIPGMPPEVAETMRSRLAVEAKRTHDTCVTPEMANRPPGELLGAKESCRYETFSMDDGKLDAVMVCKDGSGASAMRMTIAGAYGGGRYDLTSNMTMSGPAGAGGMAMKANVKGERIGACDL